MLRRVVRPAPRNGCESITSHGSRWDGADIRHSVVVTAATVYEAAALGVRAFREHGLLIECNPRQATEITVDVKAPAVRTQRPSLIWSAGSKRLDAVRSRSRSSDGSSR